MNNKLKKWEMALALSLCITFCQAVAFPATPGCNWWGVVFPGLAGETEPAAAQVWAGPEIEAGGVVLRFRILDWLSGLRN